uniref:Uncharacterized protein n=1 Tax=Bracon brevicornis TaxID=1563983 RepID=A0A6V7KS63_9HYME
METTYTTNYSPPAESQEEQNDPTWTPPTSLEDAMNGEGLSPNQPAQEKCMNISESDETPEINEEPELIELPQPSEDLTSDNEGIQTSPSSTAEGFTEWENRLLEPETISNEIVETRDPIYMMKGPKVVFTTVAGEPCEVGAELLLPQIQLPQEGLQHMTVHTVYTRGKFYFINIRDSVCAELT